MELDLEKEFAPRAYQLLVSLVTPRPIALVTTISADGKVNAAPFSFFNVMGANPPICAFAPTRELPAPTAWKPGVFCWNELQSPDSAASLAFHEKVFGWKQVAEMPLGPEGPYRIYGPGDRQQGGMMTLPKGGPQHPRWLYYIGVEDLDAALGRATRLGGAVTHPAAPVPGGARMAKLVDPQGAPFALISGPEA